MDLAKEFGDEKANKLIPDIKSSDLIHEEDLKNGEMPEEIKQKITEGNRQSYHNLCETSS